MSILSFTLWVMWMAFVVFVSVSLGGLIFLWCFAKVIDWLEYKGVFDKIKEKLCVILDKMIGYVKLYIVKIKEKINAK